MRDTRPTQDLAELESWCLEFDLLLPGIQLALAKMANRLNETSELDDVIRVKKESQTVARVLNACTRKGEHALARLAPYLRPDGSDREVQQ